MLGLEEFKPVEDGEVTEEGTEEVFHARDPADSFDLDGMDGVEGSTEECEPA